MIEMNESCFGDLFHLKIPAHRWTVSVMYMLFGLTAISLNFLIIFSIWRTPSLHKPANILLANLAITDFLVGVLGQPFMVITNIASLQNWVAGFCYCWIIGRAVVYWLSSTSLYTLAIISVDRLLAILLKNKYRTTVTVRRVAGALVSWWIGSGVIIVSVATGTEVPIDISITVIAICAFVILGTIAFCYAMSFYKLKKISSPVMPTTTETENQHSQANFRPSKYRRLLNTMALLLLTIIVFYTPYACSTGAAALVYTLYPDRMRYYGSILYRCITIAELITVINSTVNPVLYLWRMKKLREAVVSTLRMFRKDDQQQRSHKTQNELA